MQNILKLKIKNLKFRGGFTLIETIVTILLFAILGTIATTILFSVLRGATKSEILKEVKQNGDYVLSILTLKIRNARDIISACDSNPSDNVTVQNPDSTGTDFSCSAISSTISQQQVVAPDQPIPSPASLTNSSVAVSACSFTCYSSSTAPKRVSIHFTLTQAGSGTSAVDTASQTFQTQVTLRNK